MDSQNNTLESAQTCKDRQTESDVKVFVLTPADLAKIDLITKVENGQAVLLPAKKNNNVDTSTTLSQIIARKQSSSIKDVVTVEKPFLEVAGPSASVSPSVMRNPKRKVSDEQDVTITIVKQNDTNIGLNATKANNLEDVTVTVSELDSASTSGVGSDSSFPQIKRPCGNNAHGVTNPLGTATNSPQKKTAIVNNPNDPTTELTSGTSASQEKKTSGNNSHSTTNVKGKGVVASPVKTVCETSPRKPYQEKEEWTPNLLIRTCKLIPMKNQGSSVNTPQHTASGSAVSRRNTYISYYNSGKNPARRILPGFAQYWVDSLDDVGYIRCPLRACNYISLSYYDMRNHYATCAGVSVTSDHMCPVCQKRLNRAENVKLHLIRSHGPKSKQQGEAQSKPAIEREPKGKQPQRILVRKRGYPKVHKLSWTISLEQKGYIRCRFQNCGFLALSMEEMIQHYGICNGDMATQQHTSSECEVITIKQEKVKVETCCSPKQETEYVSVKEEPPCLQKWEEPEGHNSARDPLSIVEENVQKWEEPDGHSGAQDPLSIVKEECSPSEDFLWPVTHNINKTASDEDKEEAGSQNDNQVKVEPCRSSKQETEYVSVKEEPPCLQKWEEPEGHNRARDPLSIVEEYVQKWEEPDGHNGAQDPLSIVKEECSPSEDFLGPVTHNINKTESDEDEEEAGSQNDSQDVEPEVGSSSRSSEPESTDPVDVEDKSGTTNQAHWCAICNETFSQLQEMKDHIHMQECESLHSCNVSHMKGNSHLHTGEHHCMCRISNKMFKTNLCLKRQSKQDTGERNYSYSICKKAFVQSCNRRMHSNIRHGECLYRCSICDKTFKKRIYLKQHSKVHTDERPYICNVCNKTFRRSAHLTL